MKLTATNIGVDAGLILVADYNYLKNKNPTESDLKELKRLGKTLTVKNGSYRVGWSIRNTWNGNIKGTGHLDITSGKVIVVDPCYVLQNGNQERWMKWLEENDHGRDVSATNAFILNKMGGDGLYNVTMDFEKVN
jgi:hypothetical protein